jgi:xanthine dehydrogenase accessory factor
MKNIYTILNQALDKGQSFVLALIVSTKGSSPQVPGASALISDQGLVTGTLGGGILEAKAVKKSLSCLKSGKSFLLTFTLYADIAAEEEAICGGEAVILFDARPNKHIQTFRLLAQSLEERLPGVLVTKIENMPNEEVHLSRIWLDKTEILNEKLPAFLDAYKKEIRKTFAGRRPRLLPSFFLEPLFPSPQLVIAGAGHVGQAVAHLGSLLDFEVTVIDDRPEFANPNRFPEAGHIFVDDVQKALDKQPKTKDTYIVIVTRGHSQDAVALRACVGSDAAYIGMIGSARKIALMRKDFLDHGWATPGQWDKIFAPIGIDIPSKTVQEIAVSIAAQLIEVRQTLSRETQE